MRQLTATYYAPERLDDLLEVRSEVTAARGAVLSLSRDIFSRRADAAGGDIS